MKKNSIRSAVRAGLLGGAALFALTSTAIAADIYSGSYKDTPVVEEPVPDYTISVNGGLTTDYVFRGFSQSDEGPAVFAGADFTYQWFYVGIWASSVDEDFVSDGNIEIDYYAGIKKSWSGIDLDLGILYYTYPNNDADVELDYVELKAAVGTTIADTVSITGSVFYSPEFFGETGEVWTVEGKASGTLPVWDLSLSGALGTVMGEEDDFDDYTYWNVGLSKTFLTHFTVDVRYWDTADVEPGAFSFLADERIVGTVSFSY